MKTENNEFVTGKNLKKHLINLGWKYKKNDFGRVYYLYFCKDRVISLEPSIKPIGENTRILFNYYVFTEDFTSLVNNIDNDPKSIQSELSITENFYPHTYSIFSLSDLISICQEIINWGNSSSLEKLFLFWATKIPPTGLPQLKHLASLVMLKDIDTLKKYQKLFQKGDKLNFCPMITQDIIDRALEKALELDSLKD